MFRPLALALLACCALNGAATAQHALWTDGSPGARAAAPEEPRRVSLDIAGFEQWLAVLDRKDKARPAPLALPLPDGGELDLAVADAPLLDPGAQATFPDIRTFTARGAGGEYGRLSWTPLGLHAMVFTSEGTLFIDPAEPGDRQTYTTTWRHEAAAAPRDGPRTVGELSSTDFAAASFGGTLRSYRVAIAATGEYTQFHGGQVGFAFAAITATMNRVAAIFERDLSITFTLVDSSSVIFLRGNEDPFDNFDPVDLIAQGQAQIDLNIGDANYDVGHVFGTAAGGLADVGVVCQSGVKARGVSAIFSPTGDPFDVDYVANGFGAQFGALNTFNGVNGDCTAQARDASSAYEPGSGSSIMGFAGICAQDDLQGYTDPFFHSASIEQIAAFVSATATCAIAQSTGNDAPVVDAGPPRLVPAGTPFELTGSATDASAGPLTYSWEQRDLGPPQPLWQADDGRGPLFRVYPPTEEATRIFPQTEKLIANGFDNSEKLPTVARDLNFRLLVRDNEPGAGAVGWDDTTVTVVAGAGPFEVTSPNGGEIVGDTFTVTWEVAGTDEAPISASTVTIEYNTANGEGDWTVLAAGTANDGSEIVTVPAQATTEARLRLRADGHVFFDINDAPFEVRPASDFRLTGQVAVDDPAGNGNGDPEPGETNIELAVEIAKISAGTASGITASLASNTATATVVSAAADYPNLSEGESGTNTVPFLIDLDAGHPCGAPVSLALTLGSETFDFTIPTGTRAISSFSYNAITGTDAVVPIPGELPADIALEVSGMPGTIQKVTISFDGELCGFTSSGISHTWVGDLDISLVSPLGRIVNLMNKPGTAANGGDHFCRTVLDDAAGPSIQNITAAEAPFSGAYRPRRPLRAFNGENPNGTWLLRVIDGEPAADSGEVRAFTITIESGPVCSRLPASMWMVE